MNRAWNRMRQVGAWIGRGFRSAVTFVWQQVPSVFRAWRVTPSANSIVVAAIRWVQRSHGEAKPILRRWNRSTEEWEDVASPIPNRFTRVLSVLKRPNPLYGGTTLMKATVSDLFISGNAFWVKGLNEVRGIGTLSYVPSTSMMPRSEDPAEIIQFWEMLTTSGPVRLPLERVVHFRDGIDPDNPALGISPLASLLREITTDEYAANMTNSLLRNSGVPGMVIVPDVGTIPPAKAEQMMTAIEERFSGGGAGRPLVLEAKANVQVFGFSPEQLRMRELRGVPEERITAVLGVNSAVLGLGAGLATTKVGATLREYREEAVEGTLIPLWQEMAETITAQLLPDFGLNESWVMAFDLRTVRVLQEDETKRSERVVSQMRGGVIRLDEARRDLGWPVDPTQHEVYVRDSGLQNVLPADMLSEPEPSPQVVPMPMPVPPEAEPPPETDEPEEGDDE